MRVFKTFKSWKNYFVSAVKKVFIGIVQVFWSFFIGIVSVIIAIFRSVSAFCARESKAAFVVGLLFLLFIVGWTLTFIEERSARVTAEFQRDSISFKLDSAKQYQRSPMTIFKTYTGNE